jgi:poly(3-hydroxybutyrate) depolymerase
MRRVLLVGLLLGCGANPGSSPDAGSIDTPDAAEGDSGRRPEDVPAVALGGDPGALCPASFASIAPVDGLNRDFASGGQMREFVLDLPAPSFSGPRPLFVAFNGTGEDGPSFFERAQLQQFTARGFIVVAPSSAGNGTIWPIWDGLRRAGDESRENLDVAYFDELVACLGAHLPIDRNRIYIGGHSAGGIFSNTILQRRSQLIAGGIVGSGVFDLTNPVPMVPLDPMFVIVTWGGDDDIYANENVPSINFVEEASTASQYYETQGGEINCHYEPGEGHTWLDLNDWFVDRLLEHPKGVYASSPNLPATPPNLLCTDEPFVYTPSVVVACPASTTTGCQAFCQYLGDCAVENSTVNGIVGPQLDMLGWSGADRAMCGGCVAWCETHGAADTEVLSCFQSATSMTCEGGPAGFIPWTDAVNTCCGGKTGSQLCTDLCTVLATNDLVTMFATECVALAQR